MLLTPRRTRRERSVTRRADPPDVWRRFPAAEREGFARHTTVGRPPVVWRPNLRGFRAERAGFEPAVRFPAHLFSRQLGFQQSRFHCQFFRRKFPIQFLVLAPLTTR